MELEADNAGITEVLEKRKYSCFQIFPGWIDLFCRIVGNGQAFTTIQ
jgi:hypothetical protein